MGWTAYNIEPFPAPYENLRLNRPNAKNYNFALSNRIGTANFRGVKHPDLGLNFTNSSLCHTEAHEKDLIERGCTFFDLEVELTTWKAFVEKECILQVDLFVLDVEGHELSVVEGMQGCSVLPDLICVEVGHLDFNTVREALKELGYVYDISSNVNAFFIHQSKLGLFAFRRAAF